MAAISPSSLFAATRGATAGGGTSSPFAPKTYRSIDEMDSHLRSYGKQATEKYRAEFSGNGASQEMTADDVKAMIKKRLPGYTLTDKEPSGIVKGQNLLYIDDKNLEKMAKDADYRAKVMGVLDRDMQGLGQTTIDTGKSKTTMQTTGSVFSISDKNPVSDGIPYVSSSESESWSQGTSSVDLEDVLGAKSPTGKTPGSKEWMDEYLEKKRKLADEEEKRQANRTAQQQAETPGSSRADFYV